MGGDSLLVSLTDTQERHEAAQTVASVPLAVAARVAQSRSPLLVTGETGVGKGRLARWIHEHSDRRNQPFVPVNCGAIPEGVIDSHLFGHARGSFSDAHRDHQGLVRAAAGGTLFLDEVGELPMPVQIRLLRLLEEREVQPVGSSAPIPVDVRVIAATASDLLTLVNRGALRKDLFYRLNVIHLTVKPLRNRREDIPRLLGEFNAECAERTGREPLTFGVGAMRLLEGHPWPGNVRQLRTVVERLHVLCPENRVTRDRLQAYGQLDDTRDREVLTRTRSVQGLHEARLAAVRETIDVCGGNISRAANELGVHRSTIHRWLAAS